MLRLIANLQRYTRDALSDPLRRLQLSVAVIVLLNIFGTVMYVLVEGWEPIDALYMTVITIATVGYGEVRELSDSGRVFTIVLIYLGVGAATTAITNAVSLALGPVLWGSLRRRRLQRMVDDIENHYIVCGYGRMGRQILHDLKMRDEPFVLVDTNEDLEDELTDNKIPYIMGDATQDENLYSAGIERARGFVAALNSDAGNIMAVLTARELNPRLFIVARVVRQESESKLRRAGANRVINPYQIGGHRIALSILRPTVHDFLDHIFHFGEGREIEIGQLHVSPDSEFDGKTLQKSNLRDKYNVSILAIREPGGQLVITPSPDIEIQAHSELIIIGPPEAIYQLERDNLER